MMQQETHSLNWLHYMIIINLCFFIYMLWECRFSNKTDVNNTKCGLLFVFNCYNQIKCSTTVIYSES